MKTDAKGKQRRVYAQYETPWEAYRKLPNAGRYLKSGQSLRGLAKKAQQESDTEAAQRMQKAKRSLFADLFPVKRPA